MQTGCNEMSLPEMILMQVHVRHVGTVNINMSQRVNKFYSKDVPLGSSNHTEITASFRADVLEFPLIGEGH